MAVFDVDFREYDNWYDRHSQVFISEIRALAAASFTGLGIEIGVGTGRFASHFSVDYGVDPAFNALTLARSRGIKVIQAMGEELPFREESFHFALIVLTICFVDNPSLMLLETQRILKQGGTLVLATIDRDSAWGQYLTKKGGQSRYYGYTHFFSSEEINGLLQKANLRLKSTHQTLFHPPENFKAIENPRKGFGQGGFIVFKAVKD